MAAKATAPDSGFSWTIKEGSVIRRARRAANLSQQSLAKEVGLDYNTVGRIERGQHTPQLTNLVAIVTVLNLSLDHVFSRDGASQHPPATAEPGGLAGDGRVGRLRSPWPAIRGLETQIGDFLNLVLEALPALRVRVPASLLPLLQPQQSRPKQRPRRKRSA